MNTPTRTRRVAVLAFDDVEALDLAGPYEVFTTATRMQLRDAPSASPLFEVACVARTNAPVRMRAGLSILPSFTFADAPPPDVLIVPGGVVDAAMACVETIGWIASASSEAELVASVCTGAFLLAEARVIEDGSVTTHWEDIADLRQRFPKLEVQENVRWVDRGRIVTSAGITAGIDMSLHLVSRLAGEPLALRTARQMDFAWTRLAP
ncbi:MAG: DJ-1/PfpI family protein [Variovorax sp.]|nr:DJ-1/PfpI family protein [Variovorax sp.]